MAYLRIAVRKNLFINSLVERFKKKIIKMLNVSIYSFQIFLKLVKKAILHLHVTTATEICMKKIIGSCLRRALWRKIMETLTSTITVLNFVSNGFSFYYIVKFTGPSISRRTLWYKKFIVPFINKSNRPKVILKISQN